MTACAFELDVTVAALTFLDLSPVEQRFLKPQVRGHKLRVAHELRIRVQKSLPWTTTAIEGFQDGGITHNPSSHKHLPP